MQVRLVLKKNKNHPGIVYCSVYQLSVDFKELEIAEAPPCIISADLKYCLKAAQEYGYVIDNAQEVLMWLFDNGEL